MKLSSEQSDQLEQLCARVQVSAFAEAERALDALETRRSPALVPALLPAFVPEALRGRTQAQSWVSRVLGTLQPSTSNGVEEAFREKLAAFLARCLGQADATDLVSLDEACRRYGAPGWPTNHWRWLDVHAIEACLPTNQASRFALIALASFHGTGYVRERAIQLLDAETSGAELPFLLVRLNDWVDPVQRRAFRAVRARIRDDYAQHFARWLELLVRLREARRNQLSDIVQWALTLLTSAVGRPHLEALFDAEGRQLRRSAFQLAGERFAGEARQAVLHKALGDSDVGTRLWAARSTLESGLWFDEMDVDPCGAIRVWSLRARVARDEIAAIPTLRNALFDVAASVRASARFHLSRSQPDLDVANLYRDALDRLDDGAARAIAISGLAEVGTRDDAALISFLTSSQSAAVAKAAIRACARLARQDCTREFLEALDDSRVGVSKAARIALTETPLSATFLMDLVRRAVHTHARLNALLLANKLGRWDWLIALLDAFHNDREAIRSAARLATDRWLSTALRSAYRPTPPARAQLEQIRTRLARIPDLALRDRVEQAVEG
ncbi:MAG TPA: hypothetical protein VFZ61_03905 [Polyangiales bacterium]